MSQVSAGESKGDIMLCEMFDLVALHPLLSKVQRRIVFGVDAYEREVGRGLPDWGFLAIRICKQTGDMK